MQKLCLCITKKAEASIQWPCYFKKQMRGKQGFCICMHTYKHTYIYCIYWYLYTLTSIYIFTSKYKILCGTIGNVFAFVIHLRVYISMLLEMCDDVYVSIIPDIFCHLQYWQSTSLYVVTVSRELHVNSRQNHWIFVEFMVRLNIFHRQRIPSLVSYAWVSWVICGYSSVIEFHRKLLNFIISLQISQLVLEEMIRTGHFVVKHVAYLYRWR